MRNVRVPRLCAVAIGVMLFAGLGCMQNGTGSSSKGPVTLRFMTWVTPDLVTLQTKMCHEFERLHPDIKIDYSYVRGPYSDKLLTMFVGDTAPDVFWLDVDSARHWVQRGVIFDMTSYVERDLKEEDYLLGSFDAGRFGRRMYALCDGVGPVVVCYNKTAFDRAGISYPDGEWDWKEFRDLANKLTLRDERRRVSQFGYCGFQWDTLAWRPFLYVYGGHLFNEDGTKCIFDEPITIEAMKYLHALSEEDRVMPSPNAAEQGAPLHLFISNRAALMFSGSWTRRDLRRVKGMRWGIAHMPYGSNGKRSTFLAQRLLAISAHTKHPKEAWEFVRYQMSYDGMKVYLEGGDAIPTLKSIALGPFIEFDPRYPEENNNRLYIEAMSYAEVERTSPYFELTQADALVSPEIERYLILNEITAEEAVDRSARRMRIEMKKNEQREARRHAGREN